MQLANWLNSLKHIVLLVTEMAVFIKDCDMTKYFTTVCLVYSTTCFLLEDAEVKCNKKQGAGCDSRKLRLLFYKTAQMMRKQ